MKKISIWILAIILAFGCFSFAACDDGENGQGGSIKYSLYVPDGAPALSVARLLDDESILPEIEIKVVDAATIKTFVTGESPEADFCILPVNLASKFLGTGEVYSLLGTVTNGNLYIMKKGAAEDINSKSDLNKLIGKKVGVINISNVPGLTFKAVLQDGGVAFQEVKDGISYDENKVNLYGLADGTEVTPAADYDYFIVPEPAATTKQNKTSGKLSVAGSLQALYGEGNGYPQAVLVVKGIVDRATETLADKLTATFPENKAWLTAEGTTAEKIVNAVKSGFVDSDMGATFSAQNLNAEVISNCGINFRSTIKCKQDVLDYIEKINGGTDAWGTPEEMFFLRVRYPKYGGK